MKLARMRICNFQSFGQVPTTIGLESLTYILGPNGAGKTAVLQALVRMFGVEPNQRRIKPADFHASGPDCGTTDDELSDLWIEAEFEFPEASDSSELHMTIPPFFAHMQLESNDETPRMRVRLSAALDLDGEVEEKIQYVIQADETNTPVKLAAMSKLDRSMIHVHYLPARRDPSEHVSYAATSLLGRLLRAADWSSEREAIAQMSESVNSALAANKAVSGLGTHLTAHWAKLHSGGYFGTPSVSFGRSEVENLLRHLTVSFLPSPDRKPVDFNMLSDGQKSLLYISLVLTAQAVGRQVLSGETSAFDVDKLRPAIFTIIAVEEPENSLSPHYLGRVIKALKTTSDHHDAQALIATHSPALLRRVPPENIRYLRLDAQRLTTVRSIVLPSPTADAHKFVREAVQAFPELYFSRLVILGEGDSEEIVIPRVLDAMGIAEDDTSIAVVPLGGRHVNHFWRLLHGLGIPHVTLLDLDLCRYGGGWGRISYAAKQLRKCSTELSVTSRLTDDVVAAIPKWTSEVKIRDGSSDKSWLAFLELHGVYFSAPLDLDFMLLERYGLAYGVEASNEVEQPNESTLNAVLGKAHGDVARFSTEQLKLFDGYHQLFKLGSKPSSHIEAMSTLSDAELLSTLPPVFERMCRKIRHMLSALPE